MLCEKYMCESGVCVCVCENHLKRCKTSMLAFALGFRFWYCITRVSIVSCQVARGWRGHMRLHPTKLLIWSQDITRDAWWRTCRTISVCFVNGSRLSLETAWRQFWISAIFNANFSSCTVFAICQVGSDMALLRGKGQLPIHPHLHWLWRWQLSTVFRVLSATYRLFLRVRCTPQQNSQWQFWASVWLMLDSSRWHEPFGEYISR